MDAGTPLAAMRGLPASMQSILLRPDPPSYVSPLRSPTRASNTARPSLERDPLLASLSPDILLAALQHADDPSAPTGNAADPSMAALVQSIAKASPGERSLGIRAARAGVQVRAWCDETRTWQWPRTGFALPVTDDGTNGTSVDPGSNDQYVGSLPESTVAQIERRIEAIRDEREALDVESLKRHARGAHLMPELSPTGDSAMSYRHLDDLTAVVTATIIQALPFWYRLDRLLDLWAVRTFVLRLVPEFFKQLRDARAALASAWEASEGERMEQMTRHTFEVMRGVLQERISKLGKTLDTMLDALEGRDDRIPDQWIDDMENAQREYEFWAGQAERQVAANELQHRMDDTEKRRTVIHVPDASTEHDAEVKEVRDRTEDQTNDAVVEDDKRPNTIRMPDAAADPVAGSNRQTAIAGIVEWARQYGQSARPKPLDVNPLYNAGMSPASAPPRAGSPELRKTHKSTASQSSNASERSLRSFNSTTRRRQSKVECASSDHHHRLKSSTAPEVAAQEFEEDDEYTPEEDMSIDDLLSTGALGIVPVFDALAVPEISPVSLNDVFADILAGQNQKSKPKSVDPKKYCRPARQAVSPTIDRRRDAVSDAIEGSSDEGSDYELYRRGERRPTRSGAKVVEANRAAARKPSPPKPVPERTVSQRTQPPRPVPQRKASLANSVNSTPQKAFPSPTKSDGEAHQRPTESPPRPARAITRDNRQSDERVPLSIKTGNELPQRATTKSPSPVSGVSRSTKPAPLTIATTTPSYSESDVSTESCPTTASSSALSDMSSPQIVDASAVQIYKSPTDEVAPPLPYTADDTALDRRDSQKTEKGGKGHGRSWSAADALIRSRASSHLSDLTVGPTTSPLPDTPSPKRADEKEPAGSGVALGQASRTSAESLVSMRVGTRSNFFSLWADTARCEP